MEADWEFEIGPGAPVIDGAWEGLVDLQTEPQRVHEITETALAPGLADALRQLNGPTSAVWTSKCDVWQPESFDPDELDAEEHAAPATCALACYIDLLPRKDAEWASPAYAEACCRRVCEDLHAVGARSCRVDLVVRRALPLPGRESLGITAYLTACGITKTRAAAALSPALSALADTFCAHPSEQKAAPKLQ
jgi:hypothetical protein